ncbi:LADA_0E00958g1_1 [Lachancea dasiensis]|uniref:Putative lipoate-protein ligase A n=1 Tax=Lachancea dasiensis TaxID=1072105 RepID=A0A1G4JAS4_9SACH|nr:LADA_0E00958g1_1 [Lachancea dasiensis]
MNVIRFPNLITRLPRTRRVFCRSLGSSIPFDLSLDTQVDRYSELNNMYTEMFTQGDEVRGTPKGDAGIELSEIDAFNAEIADTYNYSPQAISGYSLEHIVKSPGRFILQSLSSNPYYNLALEDYVFQNTTFAKGQPFLSERLLFYINEKCVVIGKNQTPWKELHLDNCYEEGYKFVRRRSGGGAVVHDSGNVNYSYLTSRDNFDREYFNKQIVRWLKEIRPDAAIHLNQRGDIHLGAYKVSGSAFKIAKGKSYHHGTMLIDADLASFKGLLKPAHLEGVIWSGGSVESVRSSVKNISEAGFNNTDEFMDICSNGFRSLLHEDIPVYFVDEVNTSNDEIAKTARQLASDEWLYHSGPSFTVTIQEHDVSVEKGTITKSSIPDTVGLSFKDFVLSLNAGLLAEIKTKI